MKDFRSMSMVTELACATDAWHPKTLADRLPRSPERVLPQRNGEHRGLRNASQRMSASVVRALAIKIALHRSLGAEAAIQGWVA